MRRAPTDEVAAGVLWTVVASQSVRFAATFEEPFENACNVPARKAGVHGNLRALTREAVDGSEHAQSAPAGKGIGHEIERPFLIRPDQACIQWRGANEFPASEAPYRETFLAIQPVHTYQKHNPPLLTQDCP